MARFRSQCAVLVIVFLCELHHVYSRDGFIATLPQILRHQTQSEVCLTSYPQDNGPRETSIRLVNIDTQEHALELTETYTPGVQKCTQFVVPDPGNYELIIYNSTEILHDSVEVKVHEDKPLTLVQTDKPIYKPGQLVKFRILTLLHNLMPRSGQIYSVYILDPNDIRVKQYMDVDNDGLVTLEFQLVDRAKLGEWTIEVTIDETSKPIKATFEVDEYVLPRFEVTITPPAYILATDNLIKGQVCATYTYGKPVVGFLDLDVYWGPVARTKFHENVELSGCHNFTVDRSELAAQSSGPGYWRGYYNGQLKIDASVTEAGTGAVVNKTESGPREGFEPLQIRMDDYTNSVFKPGLPYFGKVMVTRPDGSPAGGEVIQVRATTSPVTTRYSKNFTTDDAGVVVFALCDSFTENSSSIALDAVAINYEENSTPLPDQRSLYRPRGYRRISQWFSPSLSYIQIPKIETTEECHSQLTLSIPFTTVPNKDINFTYQIMSRGQIVKTGQVLYNHTKSYPGQDHSTPPVAYCLDMEEPETPTTPPPTSPGPPTPPPNSEISSPPPFPPFAEEGEDNDQGENLSFAPGLPPGSPSVDLADEFIEPIVRSEVMATSKANFILDFTISTVMSPSFTLLVYHVLPDGEVVADSMEYKVQPCFENKVNLQFDKEKVLPGEDINLSLTAAPGSLCGVGVVDKSVNILGGDHQITPERVFKRIEDLSQAQFGALPMPYRSDSDYCEKRIKNNDEILSNPDDYWFYSSSFVDAIQAFKSSGFRVVSNLDIETRPCERAFPVFYDFPANSMQEGAMLEGVPGPMAIGSARAEGQVGGAPTKPKARVRTLFPETWLWSLQLVGDDGQSDIPEKAPDTVTKWVGNALCMNQEKGFGVSKMTSLTTFQPFFVSLHLPYSAVRGERLPVSLTIYNYLDKCLRIQMSLNGGEDFELSHGSMNTEPFCLCGGKSESRRYFVTPKNIGSLDIMAKAAVVSGSCADSLEMDLDYVGYSDAVRRKVLVKAEGVSQEYTRTMFVCTKENEPDAEDVILPLPENMVKDSARGEVKVIGDIMGPAMSNLENLVRMPTGCGEQNMVGFVPNICVLKYLSNTGRLTEDIETKATKHMEIGYQRELTYRHKDGSYSAFGERDEQGSVWLTAFVVKSFAQAKPYIYVDEDELTLSLTFLRRSQLENGCFRETGKVFSSYMMGGLSKGKKKNSYTALTSYVLAALLHAGVENTDQVIVEGMKCINRDFNNEKGKMEPYSLALVAYVNSLYEPYSHTTTKVIDALNAKAKKDGSLRYWSRDTPKPPTVNNWYYYAAPSAEVEMTAYALLALLNFYSDQLGPPGTTGDLAVAQTYDIAMWLSQQRNPNGGFSSTQDTVVGLQALSEFAEVAYSGNDPDLVVSVSGDGINRSFRISEDLENALLLQTEPIKKLPNKLNIRTSGTGCTLIQASVNYNKPADKIAAGGRPPFYLKVMTRPYQHDIDRCDRRTLRFNLRLRNKKFSSGMSLLAVRMVTGWYPVKDSLTKLRSNFPTLGIKEFEHKEDEGLITIYFDEMTRRPKEFSLDIEQDRDMIVGNVKPAEVKLLQYYETDVSTVRSYGVSTTCGTKMEIPRNQPEYVDGFPVQVRVDGPRGFRDPLSNPRAAAACPVCSSSKKIPKNLESLVCESAAIYKALSGRKGKKPLKIRQDVRPASKGKRLNMFAKYDLPEGCECAQLQPPAKRVFIFVRQPAVRKTVKLDRSSVVLPSSRKLDKEIRKLRRKCKPES